MHTWTRIKQAMVAGTLAAMVLGGVGSAAAAARSDDKNADVKIEVLKSADQGGVLSYSLNLRNEGGGPARDTHVDLPFDGAALQLVSTEFSKADAWVTEIGANGLEISAGKIGSGGGALHATLRFAALKAGAELTAPATVRWSDEEEGGRSISNRPNLGSAVQALSVHAEGGDYVFTADVFAPGEHITFWYNTPDGAVVAAEIKNGYVIDAASTDAKDNGADYARADSNGSVSVRLATKRLAPGGYTLVARGNSGGLIAVGAFQVK
jgi:hypothetical protein